MTALCVCVKFVIDKICIKHSLQNTVWSQCSANLGEHPLEDQDVPKENNSTGKQILTVKSKMVHHL